MKTQKLTFKAPPIPHAVLSRAQEVALLPSRMHTGTRREVNIRLLASRLKVDDGFAKAGAGTNPAEVWDNISDQIRHAIAEGDIGAVTCFAEAWARLGKDMTPAQATNRCIAGAIRSLQKDAGRAPTNREVLEYIAADSHNGIGLRVSKSAVNGFVASLGGKFCLSTEKPGKKT
jgi:hypothetical protein